MNNTFTTSLGNICSKNFLPNLFTLVLSIRVVLLQSYQLVRILFVTAIPRLTNICYNWIGGTQKIRD